MTGTIEPRRRTAALLAVLALGPGAWIVQLVAGYGLSSMACFPRDTPVGAPPGGAGMLLALNLAGLAAAMAGAVLSWRHRRRSLHDSRTHFLATCAMLMNTGSVAAILFDTAVVIGTPLCGSVVP